MNVNRNTLETLAIPKMCEELSKEGLYPKDIPNPPISVIDKLVVLTAFGNESLMSKTKINLFIFWLGQ